MVRHRTDVAEENRRVTLGRGVKVRSLSKGRYLSVGNPLHQSSRAPLGTGPPRPHRRHPTTIDIAIRRGSWTPHTAIPIRWHHFNPETFDIGRETLDTGAARIIGIYNAERSIIDAFRLSRREGGDTTMATQALKTWLKRGGQPSILLRMARAFPRAQGALRAALDILL